jgi:hypothetical protein
MATLGAAAMAHEYAVSLRDIESVAELKALPQGTTVETANGLRYVKTGAFWSAPVAKRTPPAWLLDPEHSKQPIRVVEL